MAEYLLLVIVIIIVLIFVYVANVGNVKTKIAKYNRNKKLRSVLNKKFYLILHPNCKPNMCKPMHLTKVIVQAIPKNTLQLQLKFITQVPGQTYKVVPYIIPKRAFLNGEQVVFYKHLTITNKGDHMLLGRYNGDRTHHHFTHKTVPML